MAEWQYAASACPAGNASRSDAGGTNDKEAELRSRNLESRIVLTFANPGLPKAYGRSA